MNLKVYVVTDPELGWDCVVGVYHLLENAIKCAMSRSGLDPNNWEDYIDKYHSFDSGCIFVEELQETFEE